VPSHIDTSSLRFEDFEELLKLWLEYRKLSPNDMAESFYISEEEHSEQNNFRNCDFRDVLRSQHILLSEFTGGRQEKKKLKERELVELLQRLFQRLLVYELEADGQLFVDKANFASAARDVIRSYQYSPDRELKPFDEREVVAVRELPQLLRFW